MSYESPGYQALEDAIDTKKKLNLLFYGWLGVKAGGNWYDLTGNWTEAVANGLYAAFRWKLWFGCLLVWSIITAVPVLGLIGTVQAVLQGEPVQFPWLALIMLGVAVAVGLPSVGATYVYAIDISLFRQGWVYRRLYHTAWRLRNVHWVVLHTILLLPIVVPIAVLTVVVGR
jgi:hypothetical protein